MNPVVKRALRVRELHRQAERQLRKDFMIINCSCKNEYQEKRYGTYKRIGNPTKKEDEYRCTSCGTIQRVAITPPTPVLKAKVKPESPNQDNRTPEEGQRRSNKDGGAAEGRTKR